MKKIFKIFIITCVLILLIGLIMLVFNKTNRNMKSELNIPQNIKIESQVFENNSYIPQKYTCDGENINPPLKISDIPKETQSLILIVDDPDAPMKTFLHWLVWNINPNTSLIEENALPNGAIEGKNDFGEKKYKGPCPPFGTHRYFFKIYALDTKLDLEENANINEVKKAMERHILDKAELIGLYKRR